MRSVCVVVAVLLSVLPVFAQHVCPPGQPSSPWPGPTFVPTADCRGWVPLNHPLSSKSVSGPRDVPMLAEQDIYSGFTGMPMLVSARAGGVRALSGWAVDCTFGAFPPGFKVIEIKPDGSSREIPNDFFWLTGISRPDIQESVGRACPSVYNMPASDGDSLGPNDGFGWSLALRSPITEVGVHTFTVISSWPSKSHAGASSVAVTIVP